MDLGRAQHANVASAEPAIAVARDESVNPVAKHTRNEPKGDENQALKKEQMRTLARDLNQALAPLAAQGKVRISEGALGIVVDISASALFAPGEARLDLGAIRALGAVGRGA